MLKEALCIGVRGDAAPGLTRPLVGKRGCESASIVCVAPGSKDLAGAKAAGAHCTVGAGGVQATSKGDAEPCRSTFALGIAAEAEVCLITCGMPLGAMLSPGDGEAERCRTTILAGTEPCRTTRPQGSGGGGVPAATGSDADSCRVTAALGDRGMGQGGDSVPGGRWLGGWGLAATGLSSRLCLDGARALAQASGGGVTLNALADVLPPLTRGCRGLPAPPPGRGLPAVAPLARGLRTPRGGNGGEPMPGWAELNTGLGSNLISPLEVIPNGKGPPPSDNA